MNIVLVPMGVTDNILQNVTKALKKTYNVKINVSSNRKVPKDALSGSRVKKYLGYDAQYDAESIIHNTGVLNKGDKNLIITSEPLSRKGTSVFGISYLGGEVGIFSTYRPKHSSGNTDSRIRKQAIKQIGYMIGYEHCDQPHCVMYQTETCDELDRTEETFCDDCSRTFDSKLAIYRTSDTEVYEEASTEQSVSDTRIYDPDE